MNLKINYVLASALIALLSPQMPAFAADHRDSPAVDDDPAADINDVYMFRDPLDSSKLVLVLSTYPLADPRFATTYQYDPDVVFQIDFDLTGNGNFTRKVTAQFSALPAGAGSQQTFAVTLPNHMTVSGNVTRPTIQAPQPTPVITTQNGISVFAGQRDDPFFFDLAGFNRLVANINATSVNGGPGIVDPSVFTGVDAFAGFNVEALVIEAPVEYFVGSAKTFGVAAFSYRKLTSVIRSAPKTIVPLGGEAYEQVDRMGNPAVNTALITPSLKDRFNEQLPKDDAGNFQSTLLATLTKYGTSAANIAIVNAVCLPDTLKMDLSKPDGFPNGRRLEDHATNLELQLFFNQTLGGSFGDGVEGNDEPYLSNFPFLGLPHTAPAS